MSYYLGLGELSPHEFLAQYWQKRPVVIRQAFANWSNPIAPDELAGLALEDEIESRLIRQQPGKWQLKNGPLSEADFRRLPKTDWTLLVQAVDLYSDEVATIKDAYRFIPDWRLDDVMVSLAATGGGVGPHRDQYDVFLIQGLGRRRWRVGEATEACEDLIQACGLKQISPFTAILDQVLEPGDLLYLPPGFSHEGIAVSDDCMTYSIGFRAPSQTELVSQLADRLLDNDQASPRFSDPWRQASSNPALLDERSIDEFSQLLLSGLNNPQLLRATLAGLLTQSKYSEQLFDQTDISANELLEHFDNGGSISRHPACRFVFWQHDGLFVAINGEAREVKAEWLVSIAALGQYSRLTAEHLPHLTELEWADWLATMLAQGYWLLDD